MDAHKLERVMPILRCPRDGTQLIRVGDELASKSGERYPIVNGKPVLVQHVQPMHLAPPRDSLISQNIGEYTLRPDIAALPGFKIHIGSGNVPCYDPQVISIDVLPNENVDIVAEAEHLPFDSDCFVWAEAGAVFEHLQNPLAAIAEVRRVLASGGHFYIDTAFMQGYHGFPSHFFNMMPQAVETFIIDDFDLVKSHIPISGSPAMGLEAFLRKFIEAQPKHERIRLLSMQTARLLEELSNSVRQKLLFDSTSEHIKRSLAASVCVIARKPERYADRKHAAEQALGADKFTELRRNYYAARVGVIQRYYEIEHYRGRALEVQPDLSGTTPADSLENLLTSGRVPDTLEPEAWVVASAVLQSIDASLTAVRDNWIRQYLTAAIDADEVVDVQKQLDEARTDAKLAQADAALAHLESQRLRNLVDAMQKSTSWQITEPFRRLVTVMRGIRNPG